MPKIGGNRWNDYVREFAKKNNTTYGCAISMPECKDGYKALYPKPVKGKRGRPKKNKAVDEDFGIAPENISMSIAEIEPENKKEMESMGAEDKNVSKERIDDLLDMWEKILDDKNPIKTRGAYVKRLQKPILTPLTKYVEEKRLSATQKKRYKAIYKRSNEMFANLPSSKELKAKAKAKETPYDPLEEAKPSTEPVSKGITIKKKATVVPNVVVSGVAPASTRIKASEVSALARDFQTIYSNNKTNPPMLKALAKPILTKLAGWYNANLLSKSDDKFVASLVASYNKSVKIKSGEVELEGKGRRINRVRLKRMRGGKENHSYAEEDAEVGGNVFTDLSNKVQQFRQGAKDVATQAVSAITPQPVKDIVKDVGNRFFGDELPNSVKATLKKYGDQQITGLTLGRTPVPKYITEALNVVSFGEWKKKFADKPYDTLYHLFLYIRTSGGSFGIEKNERINTFSSIPPNSQTAEVSGNFGGLTPNILLEKAQQMLGESAFKNYDPYNNNCQHFITAILKANHLGSPADLAFVKQDTESLFENSPQTATFAKTLTDLGARVSKIVGKGKRGRPRKIGGVPLQTAQILNPAFKEHPEMYYNPLLQHHGAVTQMGIPWGIGANAGGYETDSTSSSDSDSDMEGMGRPSIELKHELRNYNDILGHLSSHLLSNEKQDPRDAVDALKYARELVRVLEQINSGHGGSRIGDLYRRVTGQSARVAPAVEQPVVVAPPVVTPVAPPVVTQVAPEGLSRDAILRIRELMPMEGRPLPPDYFGTAEEIEARIRQDKRRRRELRRLNEE